MKIAIKTKMKATAIMAVENIVQDKEKLLKEPQNMVKYTYDLVGNRLTEENDTGTTIYKYNEENQLIQARDTSYVYDQRGNLITEISTDKTLEYNYNNRNLLTQVLYQDETYVKYDYDALGRKIFREEKTIDIEKLKEQNQNQKNNNGNSNGNTNTNSNNGKGNVKDKNNNSNENTNKTNNGNEYGKYNNSGQGNKYGLYKNGNEELEIPSNIESTRYVYQGLSTVLHKEYSDKGSPYGEYYNANGQVISKKMFGLHGLITPGKEETIKTNGGLMYYQYDGTRNVTELTNRHGEKIEHYRYDAFGNILTGITAPYNTVGYTGQEYDAQAGLTYMNARWYNSGVGRLMSEDTYFGTMTNPQSQNQYAYVMNNPVNKWDPSGNVPSWVGENIHIIYGMNSEFGVKLPSHTYSLVDTNTHNSSWYLKDEVKTSKKITYYYESKRTKEWIYRHSYNYTWRESPSGNSYTSIDWDTETVTFRDKDYYYKTVVDTAEDRATKNKLEIQKLAGNPPSDEDPPVFSLSYRNDELLNGEDVILKSTGTSPSSDERIKTTILQEELNRILGVNLVKNEEVGHSLKTDGWYGTNTKKAVKMVQEVYKLPKTGQLDNRTLHQLMNATYSDTLKYFNTQRQDDRKNNEINEGLEESSGIVEEAIKGDTPEEEIKNVVVKNKNKNNNEIILDVEYQSQVESGQNDLKYSYNVKKKGCALTSVSMVLNYYGADTNPQELYEGQGNDVSANWSELPNIADVENVYYSDDSGTYNYLSEYKVLNKTKEALKNDIPVIMRMSYTYLYNGIQKDGTHFVVVYGMKGEGTELSDFLVRDPGRSIKSYQNYGENGYTLQTAIDFKNKSKETNDTKINRYVIYSTKNN